MTYDEALAYIDGLLSGHRPVLAPAQRLDRMVRLLDALDLRPLGFRVVLVAGTKGKGSTATMLAAILGAAGRRVGLYTKPHVADYRERIRVDGHPIAPETLAALVAKSAPAIERTAAGPGGRPTYFEVSVVLALQCFVASRVEMGIIEVGIGGRFDAANALDPALAVITPISLDHTELLGDTLGAIAHQKAGIMRRGRPVVSAPQLPEVDAVLTHESSAIGAHLIRVSETASWTRGSSRGDGHVFHLRTAQQDYGRLGIGMRGWHQATNAATAVVAAEILAAEMSSGPVSLPAPAVARGLRVAVLPGRFELLDGDPPIVLDVAHNAASMAALRAALDDYFPGRPVVLVFGMIATHDPVEAAGLIAGRARLAVITEPAHLRALPAETLAAVVRRHLDAVEVVPDRPAALSHALTAAGPMDIVCVTGSVYLVSDVRERLLVEHPPAGLRRRSGAGEGVAFRVG
ncbi:MAG: bifunctional folylpolyglutamate synthase/dihydrofolate synthase [Armatimonadota bacterium]